MFWLMVATGLVLALRRRMEFGLLLAAPLISGALFALLHLVPLAMRLAMWIMPAAYAAVALAAMGTADLIRHSRHRWASLQPAAGVLASGLLLGLLPSAAATINRALVAPPRTNDRAAVSWLHQQNGSGDLVLLVGSAARAVQWYDQDGRLTRYRVVLPAGDKADCGERDLAAVARDYRRIIVYSGHRGYGYPSAYRDLPSRLAELGKVTDIRYFGSEGIGVVTELPAGPGGWGRLSNAAAQQIHHCFTVN